ncbi:MAG: FUSC family protein [Clostridia bacterium]|nr:FUSC family protein [Clostridia bacterium]
MNEARTPRIPGLGLRSIKTAVSATLCAALYSLWDRNPTFACIGCVFGMGTDLEDSWQNGGNRLIGTVLGGFLGMGLFRLHLLLGRGGSIYPLLFAGVLLLAVLSVHFRWPRAIQPGGVVLCIILFNTPEDAYVSYALNRMLDTGLGVILSMCINLLLPRERLDRWLEKLTRA